MKTTKRHDPVRGRAADRIASSSASGRSSCEGPGGLPKGKRAKRVLLSVRSGVLIAALGTFGVAATIGTFGSWPSLASATEPTAAEKLADLKHLGLGADGLLAAGLTVTQASSVLDWIGTDRTRFAAIQTAEAQVSLARANRDAIRAEMVRLGRTDALNAQHNTAEVALTNAIASRDVLVEDAWSALALLVSEELNAGAAWSQLSRIIENRSYLVPTAYRVLELDHGEWQQLELYHAHIDSRPEALDAGTVSLSESLALNSAVANAQSRIDDDLTSLVAWLFAQ